MVAKLLTSINCLSGLENLYDRGDIVIELSTKTGKTIAKSSKNEEFSDKLNATRITVIVAI
jgi:hypothetical protein